MDLFATSVETEIQYDDHEVRGYVSGVMLKDVRCCSAQSICTT